jgi:hypothetical protein
MKIKILSLFVAFSLLTTFAPLARAAGEARQTNDWNALRSLLDSEIAVKAGGRSIVFGVLRAVEDDSIKIQVITGENNFETVYKKAEVEKIWRAEIRGGRSVARGALIGGGIGAGVGLIAGASAKESDPLNYAGVVLFGLLGAGVGALASAGRKGNKKRELIYRA